MARRLLAKKLGFRYRMDVVPLDPSLVRGSHGLRRGGPARRPDPRQRGRGRGGGACASLADLKAHALERMGL